MFLSVTNGEANDDEEEIDEIGELNGSKLNSSIPKPISPLVTLDRRLDLDGTNSSTCSSLASLTSFDSDITTPCSSLENSFGMDYWMNCRSNASTCSSPNRSRNCESPNTTPPPKPPRYMPSKPPRLLEKKVFVCENPDCRKEEELIGIVQVNFKSCPACFTYYCSPDCRRNHWAIHKELCIYGRINSYIRTIIHNSRKNSTINLYLSHRAREGYMNKGRGCLMIVFASPNAAKIFIENGIERLNKHPTYSTLQDVRITGVLSPQQKALIDLISSYLPSREFVLNIAIVAGRNIPPTPIPRKREPTVIDNVKVPMHASLYGKSLTPQHSRDNSTSELQPVLEKRNCLDRRKTL